VSNRELNEWIAINVMGYRKGDTWRGQYPWILLRDSNGRPAYVIKLPDWAGDEGLALREVVSKMRERGASFSLDNVGSADKPWRVIFGCGDDKIHGTAEAETPALAICLAAQAAITAEGEG
jgi:hypothetical protein